MAKAAPCEKPGSKAQSYRILMAVSNAEIGDAWANMKQYTHKTFSAVYTADMQS